MLCPILDICNLQMSTFQRQFVLQFLSIMKKVNFYSKTVEMLLTSLVGFPTDKGNIRRSWIITQYILSYMKIWFENQQIFFVFNAYNFEKEGSFKRNFHNISSISIRNNNIANTNLNLKVRMIIILLKTTMELISDVVP